MAPQKSNGNGYTEGKPNDGNGYRKKNSCKEKEEKEKSRESIESESE